MKWKWPELAGGWKEALGRYKYVLLVLAAGVLLLLLPVGGGERDAAAAERESESQEFDLEQFEEKLERVLSQIEGAGEAKVVLTLDTGSRQVLAQDQERESGGGSSSTVVTVGRGSGNQEVAVIQTVAPRFRGALVVCAGGGDPQVRLALLQAVSALTGLGADKISICQGNT